MTSLFFTSVQYLLHFPTKMNTCKFTHSLFPINVNLDEVSTIEILKPHTHMYITFNKTLTVVDLKQNNKKQPLARPKGIKTTLSCNHSTTVSTLQTYLLQTLQPIHLPKPQLMPDLEK